MPFGKGGRELLTWLLTSDNAFRSNSYADGMIQYQFGVVLSSYGTETTAQIELWLLDQKRRNYMTSTTNILLESTDTNLALLRVLAENSFDSILITDSTDEGTIIYANPAFETLTGFNRTEVIGKTPRILQGVGTDEKVINRLSHALKAGIQFEGKAINYKKDGTPFIMYWRVLPIKSGETIEAWVAIQREGSAI